jgi:hypothetical protein
MTSYNYISDTGSKLNITSNQEEFKILELGFQYNF